MMARKTVVLLVALISCCASGQKVSKDPCTESTLSDASPWHVYADLNRHFCFQYPKSYAPVVQTLRSACAKLLDEKTGATFSACVSRKPFRLSTLVRNAPTGIESPPQPVHIGKNTFYYYGAGGGGVSYPDQYYFNLRGKIVSFTFDGPYESDKTPTAETKKIELRVLATFREF